MIRNFLSAICRHAVVLALFVFALGIASLLTATTVYRATSRGLRYEWRLQFRTDLARGAALTPGDFHQVSCPKDSPPSVPPWRNDCLIGKKVLARVLETDLVSPSLVEGAVACVAHELPNMDTQD